MENPVLSSASCKLYSLSMDLAYPQFHQPFLVLLLFWFPLLLLLPSGVTGSLTPHAATKGFVLHHIKININFFIFISTFSYPIKDVRFYYLSYSIYTGRSF